MTPSSEAIVFIIDDDESVCEALTSLLLCVGWNVEAFTSVAAFLARPKPVVPHCLLLDIVLPEVNGRALRHRLASHYHATPIIFITGDLDFIEPYGASEASAFAVLSKPFDDDVLFSSIELAMEWSARALDPLPLARFG